MEDAQKLLEIPNQNVPMHGYVFQNINRPQSWEYIEDPVVPLELKLYGHPLAGLMWARQFEKKKKHGQKLVGKKYQFGNAYKIIENKSYSYRSSWMTSKWPERRRI